MEKFSVLMSLYIKEKAEYFDECMKSILHQTVMPSEIVIVEDGPLSKDLSYLLNQYENEYKDIIKIIHFEKNQGLGLALKAGVEACSYELIARMDTDDVAVPYRFERQLKEFENDDNLDICGSHIKEFDKNINNIISIRKVPLTHNEIAKYQKKRSAFNHMTVMYKKSSVLKAGNYEDCPLMEDDMLWVRMLISGVLCKNIDDYLVFARTGIDMIKRRGGGEYYKKYILGRKKIRMTNYISYLDYYVTVFGQFFVAFMPDRLRGFIFADFLRNRDDC